MDSDRIAGSAKEIGGKFEEMAGKVVNDEATRASGVGRQIEGKGQNLYGQAKDNLRDAGNRAERALRGTGALAEQVFDEGSHQARIASDAFSDSVASRPATSMLLAFAVGFVAGVVVRRS